VTGYIAYADFIIVAVHWSQAGPPDRDGYLRSRIPFFPHRGDMTEHFGR
jgi:hypothetical protein